MIISFIITCNIFIIEITLVDNKYSLNIKIPQRNFGNILLLSLQPDNGGNKLNARACTIVDDIEKSLDFNRFFYEKYHFNHFVT